MRPRSALLVAVVLVGCGTVRTPFSGGPEEHAGEILCHGVLLPAKGAPRALFLCAGRRAGCETSRREQIAKGYTVSDCAEQPHAACMATSDDDGQICLGSLGECRDFAQSASRDPKDCTPYDGEVAVRAGAFSGAYETNHGDAAVLRHGSSVEIRLANGLMNCALEATEATCTWAAGEKKGRAKLEQQTDGSWIGTRGEGEASTGTPLLFRRKR